jgi:hypothetical protein
MASFNPLGNASARPATCDSAKSHAPLTKLKTNFDGATLESTIVAIEKK